MSCKYCKLKMRPIDNSMEVLKGENWTDEYNEGGYIGQLYDDKFQMIVYYDSGFAFTTVDNVKYCPFCGEELKMPVDPLIKDEKTRKAVKAWAEANDYDTVLYDKDEDCVYSPYSSDKTDTSVSISFDLDGMFNGLEHRCSYDITELCGDEE